MCSFMMSSRKKAIVLLYPLAEEIEISVSVAILRRGGVDVTLVAPDMSPNIGARLIKTLPEMTLRDALKKGPYDAVVLSGGQFGWRALSQCPDVGQLLRDQLTSGRILAAICTSPIALRTHKVGYGKKLTSHPLVENMVREGGNYTYKYDTVVIDGNLITSRGPITTYPFALTVLEKLTNRKNTEEVATEMLMDYSSLQANLLIV